MQKLINSFIMAIFAMLFYVNVESSTPMPYVSDKAIHCSAFGFKSELSLKVLQNVLSASTDLTISDEMQIIESTQEVSVPEKKPLIALEFDSQQFQQSCRNDSDVSIVYVHYASVLNDSPSIIANMNRALKAVISEGGKRSILICLAVPQKFALSEYQNTVLNILSEAWQLLPEKENLTDPNISGKFDIQMLTYVMPTERINSQFQFEKRTVIDGLLARQDREYRVMDELKFVTKKTAVPVSSNMPKIGGIDICMAAAEHASDWAREGAQVFFLF